ncbi:MAG: molybdenum cofactor biosynthesis protein B [Gemmatimonadota bacterium]
MTLEPPVRVGVLTVSDGVAGGTREDESGALLVSWAREAGCELAGREVVPDERTAISRVLIGWADEAACDLILTTGGTGLASRDVTPEATRDVTERDAPGIAEALRAAGSAATPYAALSRGVAAVRGRTLIVNLPGSPGAVRDGIEVLSRISEHAVALLRGAATSHD